MLVFIFCNCVTVFLSKQYIFFCLLWDFSTFSFYFNLPSAQIKMWYGSIEWQQFATLSQKLGAFTFFSLEKEYIYIFKLHKYAN